MRCTNAMSSVVLHVGPLYRACRDCYVQERVFSGMVVIPAVRPSPAHVPSGRDSSGSVLNSNNNNDNPTTMPGGLGHIPLSRRSGCGLPLPQNVLTSDPMHD